MGLGSRLAPQRLTAVGVVAAPTTDASAAGFLTGDLAHAALR